MKGYKTMVTMQTVLDQLAGREIVESLIGVMAENFEDFAVDQKRFNDAIGVLQDELGDDVAPSVKDVIAAIERQTASNLIFSGFLGLKANLDNFIDPVSRNFLDVDFETYLRDNTARRLPEYERAQEVRDKFYSLLSPAQKEIYEDVTEYVSHLETVGPKLAHYYGYLLGNEILYHIIPGYHSDVVLTMRYCTKLEEYLGKTLREHMP